ncbi:hypothetical protein HOY82DRAFT_369246 [Tuber indicum]|nr:hypothetical protein HOY82DRAFT_369246 [Tuber indicum]
MLFKGISVVGLGVLGLGGELPRSAPDDAPRGWLGLSFSVGRPIMCEYSVRCLILERGGRCHSSIKEGRIA